MVRTKPQPTKGKGPNSSKSRILQLGNKRYVIKQTLLKSIRKLQSTVAHCIPKKPFSSLIREVIQQNEQRHEHLRIQHAALMALQEAAEMYLVGLFEDSNMCAAHAKRITLRPGDVKLALSLRGDYNGIAGRR